MDELRDASLLWTPAGWRGDAGLAAEGGRITRVLDAEPSWDGGWVLPDYVSKATFNWDFIGIPGGNQALVADAIVVSKSVSIKLSAATTASATPSGLSRGWTLPITQTTNASKMMTHVRANSIPVVARGAA